MEPANQTNTYDDEISLIELWQILMRRKLIIAGVFVACVIAGVSSALVATPIYEASATLRIGKVHSGTIEDAGELNAQLLAQYGENIAVGLKRPHPFLRKVAVQKGSTTLVQLTVEAKTAEDAATLLQKVTTDTLQAHDTVYENRIAPVRADLESIEAQRAALQQQHDDITAMFERVKTQDNVQASLILFERGPILNSIRALDKERMQLAEQISPPQSYPSELLSEIVPPSKPSKPNKRMIAVLSAAFGLMGGIMLAFVAEFFARVRQQTSRGSIA